MEKLILILCWFLTSCTFDRTVRNENWMSVSYIKCLEKHLPCDCQKKEIHSLIRLNLQDKYATIYDGIIYDPNTFDIKEINNGFFQAFYTKSRSYKNDTLIVIGMLQIINDTLYFTDNDNIKIAFINYGNPNDGIWAYDKEHVRLMNQALLKRNYEPLDKILNNDSLKCGCNKELGEINLIHAGSQIYILEQSKDSLFIYEWTNIPEDPADINIIDKKLYRSFNWSIDKN
jgi:hypothetical protein